jgi:hypothetical protein
MDPGVLKSGLDMIEEMLGFEHFRMTPKQPAQKVFSGATGTNADFPQRRLERFVVAEAASAERLLDRTMEVVALELRDPSGTVAPHPRQAKDLSFAHPGAEQHRDDPQEAQILLSDVLVGRRAREPECDIEPFEHGVRDADLIAQLVEGPVGTWRTASSELDIAECEVAGGDAIRDGVRVDPDRVETKDETGPQHVPWGVGSVFGLEDVQLGELSDALRGRTRALRDLILGEPVDRHVTYDVGSALKAS